MTLGNRQQDTKDSQGLAPQTHVRLAPGLKLSAAQLALLQSALPKDRDILVKQEFRSGYSGAIVLLVSVGAGRAPLVVKIAHPHDLQREYEAYEEYVRQISPQNIAHLQGKPQVSEDGQLGLLQYTFAGGESNLPTNSLQAYYRSVGATKTAEVLNRIFRVFGRHWWGDNRARSFVLDEYYDRFLPVHLQAEPDVTDDEPDFTVHSGNSDVLLVTEIEQGQKVHLVGFVVLKSRNQGRRLTVMAEPPANQAAAAIRIRVQSDSPTQYRPGEQIDSLMVRVTATRMSLLGDAAKEAIPDFDPTSETMEIADGQAKAHPLILPNPLVRLPLHLYNVVEAKVSIIHGDLNMQNILVDAPTGFAWLIDFAETRTGPTLLDLQRLEVQVITKLLPGSGDVKLADMVDLMRRLHSDPPQPPPPNPVLHEPYLLLITIRRLARQYLVDDLDWNQYYYGLLVALVGALKFDELDLSTRALAFVTAAAAEDLIGKPIQTSQHNEPATAAAPLEPVRTVDTLDNGAGNGRKNRLLFGVAGALVAILLVAVIGWRVFGGAATQPLDQPIALQNGTRDAPPSATDTVRDTNASSVTSPSSTTNVAEIVSVDQNTEPATPESQDESSSIAAAIDQPTSAPTPTKTAQPTAQLGDTYRNEIDNALYLFVPESEFEMGSEEGRPDESPVHTVSVPAFWLMQNEVTNQQYAQCVDAGACSPPGDESWINEARSDHPVVHVSWDQAVDYANWAGGRLPTEAEWELAARGDDGRSYPWGAEPPDAELLNFNFLVGSTMPTGSYAEGAGPFGHLDMAGNAEEWVADRYQADYYSTSPTESPTGPEEGPLRSVRGGSYYSNGMDVRTFAREKALPDAHFDSVGFRVAMDIE